MNYETEVKKHFPDIEVESDFVNDDGSLGGDIMLFVGDKLVGFSTISLEKAYENCYYRLTHNINMQWYNWR